MEAPRACKCGKELLPAESQLRSGLVPKTTFGCADCGETLAIFGVVGEPDIEVWLGDWATGGQNESLSAFLKRAVLERRKKTNFSSEA